MGLSVTGVLFVCLGTSCALIAGVLTHREIGEVNRKLPDEEQISYSFMYPSKMQKIKAEYHRLYPTGRVDAWRSTFQIGLFVFLALAAITSGFFK
jgi:hypothetical protein